MQEEKLQCKHLVIYSTFILQLFKFMLRKMVKAKANRKMNEIEPFKDADII